jgi:hypothetical protein
MLRSWTDLCNWSVIFLDFKLWPCSECCVLSSGLFTRVCSLTLSNPIFLPPVYSPALIYFRRKRGWWVACNYPPVLKEKNINRKSTTLAICWLKSILHEEKRREQENHNVGRNYDFPVPDGFPHVVRTLANR